MERQGIVGQFDELPPEGRELGRLAYGMSAIVAVVGVFNGYLAIVALQAGQSVAGLLSLAVTAGALFLGGSTVVRVRRYRSLYGPKAAAARLIEAAQRFASMTDAPEAWRRWADEWLANSDRSIGRAVAAGLAVANGIPDDAPLDRLFPPALAAGGCAYAVLARSPGFGLAEAAEPALRELRDTECQVIRAVVEAEGSANRKDAEDAARGASLRALAAAVEFFGLVSARADEVDQAVLRSRRRVVVALLVACAALALTLAAWLAPDGRLGFTVPPDLASLSGWMLILGMGVLVAVWSGVWAVVLPWLPVARWRWWVANLAGSPPMAMAIFWASAGLWAAASVAAAASALVWTATTEGLRRRRATAKAH